MYPFLGQDKGFGHSQATGSESGVGCFSTMQLPGQGGLGTSQDRSNQLCPGNKSGPLHDLPVLEEVQPICGHTYYYRYDNSRCKGKFKTAR